MMTDTDKKSTKAKKPSATTAKLNAPKTSAPAKVAAAAKPAKSNLRQMRASHDEIASLAHRFWTERGGQHGHDTEDWLRAELELRGKAS
jgi:Protein of unknown function (DUF2934)